MPDQATDPWDEAAKQFNQAHPQPAAPAGQPQAGQAPAGGSSAPASAGDDGWKLWQQNASAPDTDKPGFFRRLYENTLGGPVSMYQNYAKHTDENTPRWGIAAGIPALGQTILDASGGISNSFMDAAHKTGDALKQGDFGKAVQQAPGMVPFIGPPAVQAGEDVGKGNYAGAAGDVVGLGASLAAPKIIKGALRTAGKVIKAPAAPIAESALGIRGAQRAYGATPGPAILEDTTGVRPEDVERSAQQKANALNADLEARARQSNDPASLLPARNEGTSASQSATGANSTKGPRSMQPMIDQLTKPVKGFAGQTIQPAAPMVTQPSAVLGPNGQPLMINKPGPLPPVEIAPDQAPIDLLHMKRQFGKDFVDDWKPNDSAQGLATAKKMYHGLDTELDRTVPGASRIDQRIQSLLPVIDRSAVAAQSGTTLEKALARIAKPTGALAGAITGMIQGGNRFGVPGALFGGMAGLGGPEVISSPVVQMAAARTLHGVGQRFIGAAPAAGGTIGNLLRTSSLLRPTSPAKPQ